MKITMNHVRLLFVSFLVCSVWIYGLLIMSIQGGQMEDTIRGFLVVTGLDLFFLFCLFQTYIYDRWISSKAVVPTDTKARLLHRLIYFEFYATAITTVLLFVILIVAAIIESPSAFLNSVRILAQ